MFKKVCMINTDFQLYVDDIIDRGLIIDIGYW